MAIAMTIPSAAQTFFWEKIEVFMAVKKLVCFDILPYMPKGDQNQKVVKSSSEGHFRN